MNTDRNELRATLRERFPRDHGQLLPALHFLQHQFGHLPDWGMEVVGWHLGIPASEVYGAATSYTELRLEKPGAHVLRVCTGLSCLISGGKELLSAAKSELCIDQDGIPSDGLVTLEETPCGFICGVAPAVELDGSWRGRATVESVRELVREVARA